MELLALNAGQVMQAMVYMRLRWLWLMMLALGLSLQCLVTPASADVNDRPQILYTLQSTPAANLSAYATELVKTQPDNLRLLTLDLIFYRWANNLWASDEGGVDPGINNLDQIVKSLVTVSNDPLVSWAAANLGCREWISTASIPAQDDERITALTKAKSKLGTALDSSRRAPTRSIDDLIACANSLNTLQLNLSYAFVTTKLAEKQFYSCHRYRDAEANFERAHPIFTAYGLRAQVARIFDDLGHLQSEVGHYSVAYQSYVSSAAEWQAIGRRDLAGKQYVSAGLARAAGGNPEFGLSAMLHGLTLSSSYAHEKKQYVTHAQLLIQVASFYISRGDYKKANECYLDAERITKLANDSLLEALVLREHSVVWKALGKDNEAKDCITRRYKLLTTVAEEGSRAASQLENTDLSPADLEPVLTITERGAAACEALGLYEKSAAILKQLSAFYESNKRDRDRIRVLRSLATQYDALSDQTSAVEARKTATELAKSISDIALVVEILREIERAALDRGDTQTALDALWEAVDLVQMSGDVLALADVIEARGIMRYNLGETVEAIRDLEHAASTYAAILGEPWSQARVLLKLANIQSDANKTADAIKSLSTAIIRIEEWLTSEGIDPNLEPGRSDMIFNLYLQMIELQLGEGQKTAVLDSLRNARRYSWFNRLRAILTASGDPVAKSALDEVDKTADIYQPPSEQGTLRKIADGWPEVISQAVLFSRIARGGRELEGVAPVDAADIHAIRSKLPEGMAVIEYAVSDKGVFALVATSSTASCWELPVTAKQIRNNVERLQKVFSEMEKRVSSGSGIGPVKDWGDASLLPILDPLSSLNESLIHPISSELVKINSIAFILPDILLGVPFHAFAQDKRGRVQFLIQDFSIFYLSPGTMDGLKRSNPTSLTAKKSRITVFTNSASGLRGVKTEADSIRSAYGDNCRVYTGANLSADRFVSAASWSNIIHVATHHKLDPNPVQFSLVLSPFAGPKGTVRFSDLMKIDNKELELIVLSACETISTTDSQISGAPHTAEIFALAGFPSIIGALWQVSDEASTQLMTSFYTQLAALGQKAVALQRAQRFMIESKDGKYAHPYYWAGFVLYGDPR